MALTQVPGPQIQPDEVESASHPTSNGMVKEVGPHQFSSASMTDMSVVHKRRQDVQVVVIASAVETEVTRFQELVRRCQEDPMQREDLEEESLTPWTDIPVFCAFRIVHPRQDGKQRWATPADKLEQRQKYAKCRDWALHCGLSEDEFEAKLKGAPAVYSQRGHAGLPACLRLAVSKCSSWQHAKRECMDVASRRSAADTGRRLGGEQTAEQATEEM